MATLFVLCNQILLIEVMSKTINYMEKEENRSEYMGSVGELWSVTLRAWLLAWT